MNAPPLPREAGALEAMTHLKQKICLMWGSPELDIFISRLIMDSRDGQRQGLPMEVGAELLFLAQINKVIRAIDLVGKQGISLKEAYGLIDAGDQRRLESDTLDNPLVSRDTVIRESGSNRRSGQDRRNLAREEERNRRSGMERRNLPREGDARADGTYRSNGQERQQSGDGAFASFGKLVFKLVTSKVVIILIAVALTAKLLWPYLAKLAG